MYKTRQMIFLKLNSF